MKHSWNSMFIHLLLEYLFSVIYTMRRTTANVIKLNEPNSKYKWRQIRYTHVATVPF